jgi:outer membrane protein TolC
MKLKSVLIVLFSSLSIFGLRAQNIHSFSAKQAVDFAMQNAVEVKNALLDIQIQKQSNREITALAYPQLNGSIGGTHFIDIPVTNLPNFISPSVYSVLINNGVVDGGGNPIQFPAGGFGNIAAKFGTAWNANGGMDISQILFDGQVFIGLKARSAAITLATQSAAVTKEQIKANVYKLYYQLIVGKKQATSIDANIERFENLLKDTKEIYKNGFAEQLDVDKVEVQLNNLKTEKIKIDNQLEIGNAALKFLINLPQKETLILTDSLNEDEINSVSLTDSINFKNRVEYQQLSTVLKLNNYNIKRYQYSKIPTLAAFGSYSKNAQRNAFNFFEKGDWFTTSIVGIKMTVPIFDGNARNARIQKAKLELLKTKNTMKKLEEGIEFEVSNATMKLKSALTTLVNQKANTALAEKVFNTTKLKYEQGLGSNIEIYNAQTELKVAQNNLYAALYDAIIAKVDFQKANGTLQ